VISFSATSGGTLEGKTSWTISNAAWNPIGPLSVRFKAGDEAETVLLTLSIAVPNEDKKEFYWDINIE